MSQAKAPRKTGALRTPHTSLKRPLPNFTNQASQTRCRYSSKRNKSKNDKGFCPISFIENLAIEMFGKRGSWL
jgi:hypothetical protein